MPHLIRYEVGEKRITVGQRMRQAMRSFWRPAVPLVAFKGELGAEYGYSGDDYAAGIYGSDVNHNNAFTFSAVYDAVNQISSDVAKLPLNLRKYRQTGGSDVYDESDVHWLFKRASNPETKSFDFRRTLTAHALTDKGGFAEIQRDGLGRPRALWILTPDRVLPYRERTRKGAYGPLNYKVDGDREVPPSDMFHIRGLGYDGTMGYDVINLARKAIGLGLSAENFGSTLFRQGTYGGLLNAEEDLDADQQKPVRAEIEKYKNGYKQFLILFGRKWNYQRTTASSTDVGLERTREQQIEDVARFFNIPIHKLKVARPGAMSYASVEANNVDYLTGCLMNWLVQWETEANFKLVPNLEKRQQFFKHNTAAIVRGDIKSRYEAYAVLMNLGVLSADEVRELEDMNPQPGGQGALYFVQGAMVPKNQIEAVVQSQIKKNETPKQAPAAPEPPTPNGNDDGDARVLLQAAIERAERAELAATAAQEQAATARAALAAAEASGTAKEEELVSLRSNAQQATIFASTLTEQAASANREARQLEQTLANERIERAAERTALESDRDHARSAATAAQEQLTRAESARSEAEAARDLALTRAEAAETSAGEATERATAAMVERDTARARVDVAEQARATAETARQDADEQLAAGVATFNQAQAARAQAEEQLAIALRDRQSTEAELSAARATVEDAVIRARDAAARVAALEQQVATTDDQLRVATARAAAAESAAQSAQQHAETAAAEAERCRGLADAAEGARATAEAEIQSVRGVEAEARAQLARAEETLGILRADLEQRTSERDAIDRQRIQAETEFRMVSERLDQEVTAHATTRQAGTDRLNTLEREFSDERTAMRLAEHDGAAAIVAAHRDMIVDIMRRMVDRESDRARRAQGSPDKFRRWAETFYEGHEDLMRTALLPAVRVHLAFIRSDEDPLEMSRRLAAGHVDESRRQLLTVMDGDADELGASIAALMHRWESERPNTIANLLMQKELEYVASRG